jgi:hypothetical protein
VEDEISAEFKRPLEDRRREEKARQDSADSKLASAVWRAVRVGLSVLE